MTRIERCAVHLLVHHLDEPRGPSCAWYESRESVLVHLLDSDGRSGWGEAGLRAGVVAAARELGESLVGRDPTRAATLADDLQRSAADPWAISALSIALDDLRARTLGVDVATLYGGRRRDTVRPYASSGGYQRSRGLEETWREDVDSALALGFDAYKFRIGRFPPAQELPLLAKLRNELGAGIDLMADGNGGYSFREAVVVGRELDALGFVWLEEPMIRERGNVRHPGYDSLAAVLELPVAGGEGLTNRSDFDSALTRQVFDVIQPDVTICGGVAEALFVGQLAALRGRACAPHCWGGAIALAATLQLLAVLPHEAEVDDRTGPFLEYDTFENRMRTELAGTSFEVSEGKVRIPCGPGLGIDVDESFVERLDVLDGV